MSICKSCGAEVPEGNKFCANCGKPVDGEQNETTGGIQTGMPNSWQYREPQRITEDMLPPEYKPLSAWAYFGYNILFSIPIVGFILLIVFACSTTNNVNLRKYARSFFISMILAIIIIVVILVALMPVFVSEISNYYMMLF